MVREDTNHGEGTINEYNPLSTAGNLLFSNPIASSLPGSIYKSEGNFLSTWGKNMAGDAMGNIGVPGGSFGMRLGLEGFTIPLFGNLFADVFSGGFSK